MPRKLQPAKRPPPPKPPRLSKDRRTLFEELEQEVSLLFLRWKLFRQLFATNEERIKLMGAISPVVFGEIQSMLLDEVFLGIARITDRRGKYDKAKGVYFEETVVLDQLKAGLGNRFHRALAADLDNRLKHNVEPKCRDIRKHRHKRIAHADKLVLLKPKKHILPKVTLQTVDDALDAIADYVNAFRMVFYGSPMMFRAIHSIDDGDSLIEWLKYAFEFDQMCREPDGWTLHKRVEDGLFGKA